MARTIKMMKNHSQNDPPDDGAGGLEILSKVSGLVVLVGSTPTTPMLTLEKSPIGSTGAVVPEV